MFIYIIDRAILVVDGLNSINKVLE